jgi:hypothetical protein
MSTIVPSPTRRFASGEIAELGKPEEAKRL